MTNALEATWDGKLSEIIERNVILWELFGWACRVLKNRVTLQLHLSIRQKLEKSREA